MFYDTAHADVSSVVIVIVVVVVNAVMVVVPALGFSLV